MGWGIVCGTVSCPPPPQNMPPRTISSPACPKQSNLFTANTGFCLDDISVLDTIHSKITNYSAIALFAFFIGQSGVHCLGSIFIVKEARLDLIMDNGGSLSLDTVGSSFCHACQGLFDLKSPRGCVIDNDRSYHPEPYPSDPERASSRYIYVYIHHANAAALLASARAGCSLCKMMCDRAKDISWHYYNDAELVLAQESDQPNSQAHATLSNDDFLTATRLAELVKRDGLPDKSLLWGPPWAPHDAPRTSRRIILLNFFDEKPGLPRGDGSSSTAVYELTLGNLLRHFYIPCMCDSDQGVFYLLASAQLRLNITGQTTQLTPIGNIGLPRICCQKLTSVS